MNKLTFAAATTLAVAILVAPGRILAEVQDAYVEKTYCVDGSGSEIRFENQEGHFPPRASGEEGAATIIADRDMLSKFSFLSQQFLFTRACLAAAARNVGDGSPSALECETSRFMMRRFKTSPSEVFEIVTELGERKETQRIARQLNDC